MISMLYICDTLKINKHSVIMVELEFNIVLTIATVIICIRSFIGTISNNENNKLQIKWKWLNFWVGVFHVISALVLGWLTQQNESSWDAPVYSIVSIWQPTTNGSCTEDGACFVDPVLYKKKTIPIVIFAVLFGIISGYAHLFAAGVNDNKLQQYAETGFNPYRWIDYAFSSSIMILVIACLSGVLDLYVLIIISIVQAYLIMQAGRLEYNLTDSLFNGTSMPIFDFIATSFVYVVAVWLPVIISFYESLYYAKSDVPDWINIMIWALFVLFTSFAFVMIYYLMYCPTKYATKLSSLEAKKLICVKQELAYIFLSLSAKLTLHWVLYTGITSRSGVLFTDRESATNPNIVHNTGKDNSEVTSNVLMAAFSSIIFSFGLFIFSRYQILKEYKAGQVLNDEIQQNI